MDAGVRRWALAGVEGLAAAGDVVIVPPDVPHVCEPVRDAVHSYRVNDTPI
jgi:quercetin dioxygenase-like cupin family protein